MMNTMIKGSISGIIAVLFLSLSAYSQVVTLTTKAGEAINTKLTGSSKTQLFSREGSYKLTDLDTVKFKEKGVATETLLRNLAGASIAVTYGSVNTEFLKRQEAASAEPLAVNMAAINAAFYNYNKAKATGKVLQIIGVGLLAYSGYALWFNNDPDNFNDLKDLSPFIPAIGGLAFTVGVGLDLDAGKKLRIK